MHDHCIDYNFSWSECVPNKKKFLSMYNQDRKPTKCAPGTISSNTAESVATFTWPIKQPAMISQLILAYIANLYNLSIFHMHCVDMNPRTCYRLDWIWQSTGVFSCMTHPYSWFGLQMTPPYMSARPIRTVTSVELSILRLTLQLLRNFLSIVYQQIKSNMHQPTGQPFWMHI